MLPFSSPKTIPKIGNLPCPDIGGEPRIYHQLEPVIDFSTPPRSFCQNSKIGEHQEEKLYRRQVVRVLKPAPKPEPASMDRSPTENTPPAAIRDHEMERSKLQALLNQHAPPLRESQQEHDACSPHLLPRDHLITTPTEALRILDRHLDGRILNTGELLKELHAWLKSYNFEHRGPPLSYNKFAVKILNRTEKFLTKPPVEYEKMMDKTRRVYVRIFHWLKSIGEEQREQILDMDLSQEAEFRIE